MDKKSSSSNLMFQTWFFKLDFSNLIFQTLSADQLENSPVPSYLHIFSNQFIYYKFFNNTGIIQQGQINFCSSIQWPKYFIWEEGSSRIKRLVTSIGNTGNVMWVFNCLGNRGQVPLGRSIFRLEYLPIPLSDFTIRANTV